MHPTTTTSLRNTRVLALNATHCPSTLEDITTIYAPAPSHTLEHRTCTTNVSSPDFHVRLVHGTLPRMRQCGARREAAGRLHAQTIHLTCARPAANTSTSQIPTPSSPKCPLPSLPSSPSQPRSRCPTRTKPCPPHSPPRFYTPHQTRTTNNSSHRLTSSPLLAHRQRPTPSSPRVSRSSNISRNSRPMRATH